MVIYKKHFDVRVSWEVKIVTYLYYF